MNPQERQLVDDLFERLSKLESSPRDADATAAISQGLSRAPNAIYPLVQTVLLQDEALKRAVARIEELEGRANPQQAQGGGFLDSMRGAIFGQQQSRGSVPSVPASDPGRPVWNGAPPPQQDPRGAPYAQPDPRAQQGGGLLGGGGGSFLGTAAAAAVGMVGGSMLMNSLGGMMGGNRHGFGDSSSMGKGNEASTPWSGDQSKGDLAREAGVNDIGRGSGRDADATRQSAFDQASNDDGDEDADDYDSDDSDSGDSDYA
jgi:uncharacterized protein